MKVENCLVNSEVIDAEISIPKNISIDASKFPNMVLKRLIEEVKNESINNITAYNRTHNRHNRGR